LDMTYDYSSNFVKKLKKEYRGVNLFLSGGYDSVTVLDKFAQNNLKVDKTSTLVVGKYGNACNQEVHQLAEPAIEKYKQFITEPVIVERTYDEMIEWFSDPYRFFTEPGDSLHPYGFGGLRVALLPDCKHEEELTGLCHIKGTDKPQLLFYNNNWYVVCLDGAINGDTDIPNMMWFWLEGDNIKSLVQDARKYRDYLVNNQHIEKKLQFFKPDQSEHMNVNILGRTPIADPDGNIKKDLSGKKILAKHKQRLLDIVADDQIQLLTNYFVCQNIFEKVFSQYDLDDLGKINSGSKFCWLIDIDSLEVYTQQELLPNGFDNPEWL